MVYNCEAIEAFLNRPILEGSNAGAEKLLNSPTFDPQAYTHSQGAYSLAYRQRYVKRHCDTFFKHIQSGFTRRVRLRTNYTFTLYIV